MRLDTKQMVTDHDLLQDVGAEDHHVTAVEERILVNSLSIPNGSHLLRIALGKTGCRTVQAILRGTISTELQGHTGVWVIGGPSSGNSSAVGIRPYPSGLQVYVGGYSRIHGDSALSYTDFGQNAIRLVDCYIDGSDAVFEFFNSNASNRNLTVYGSLNAK